MLTLMRNGGSPMFFVLAFGAIGLLAAGYYAFRPNAKSYGFILWMGGATLFATLAGTFAALGATAYSAVRVLMEESPVRAVPILIEGFAESMSAGIMGFAFLAVTAMVTAVGKVRS